MNINLTLSNFLNFIRWFAAFLVLINHLRSIMFVEYSNLLNTNIYIKIFYFITGFGHEAVIIFFILSGYLVGSEFIESKKTKEDLKKYFLKRFTRIYVVLIPALIVTFILDFLGYSYFNTTNIYNNSYQISAINYSVIERLNIETFIYNIFMLQTSLSETFGSNGPLWSLAFEWWYYIILPILYILLTKKSLTDKIMYISILVIFMLILNLDIFIYFFVWLIGVMGYKYKKDITFKLIYKINITLLMIILISSRLNYINYLLSDLLLSINIIIIINQLYYTDMNFTFISRFNKLFSSFSYSLYLFHFPFIFLLFSFLDSILYVRNDINQTNFIYYMLLIITTYIFSFLMYILFERNTKYIFNKLNFTLTKRNKS